MINAVEEATAGFHWLADKLRAIRDVDVVVMPGDEGLIGAMPGRAEFWEEWQAEFIPLIPQDCHTNLAVLVREGICSWATGWAWNEMYDRWVRHSWGYIAEEKKIIETTMPCSMLYYGYRLHPLEEKANQSQYTRSDGDAELVLELLEEYGFDVRGSSPLGESKVDDENSLDGLEQQMLASGSQIILAENGTETECHSLHDEVAT
jgi:hypothetical protein